MDSPSISLVPSPSLAPPGAAPSALPGGGDAVRGADFANLFKNLMDPQGRQELAASAQAGLASLHLSPNLDVITADQPLPDNASLLAFARSQGLDDGTLKALFTPAAVLPTPLAGAEAGLAAASLPWLVPAPGAHAPQAPGQAVPLADAGMASLMSQVQVQAVSVTRLGAGLPPANPVSPIAPPGSAGAAASASLAQAVAAAMVSAEVSDPLAPAVTVQALAHPKALVSGLPTATDLAALASADAPETLATAAAQGAAQVAAAQAGRQALQDSLRLRLQPQEHITQRLALMAASGEQAKWSQISGPAALETEPLLLGLAADWAELASGEPQPLDAEAPLSTHAALGSESHRGSQAAANAASASQPASSAAERVDQYEQLAQRLGQALGERLQAQIERGEWKVRMQVDPASLGRIEMELDMRAGGLDAVFRSDNQLTRDLISQSLQRLRESLAQSGTTVANVWVQGDSSRQSGGNPTPWREAPSARSSAQTDDELNVTPPLASRPRVDGSDWDLLA